ncbi:hypothetical protein ACFLZ7_00630 [Nanoarchaeota archaeon]
MSKLYEERTVFGIEDRITEDWVQELGDIAYGGEQVIAGHKVLDILFKLTNIKEVDSELKERFLATSKRFVELTNAVVQLDPVTKAYLEGVRSEDAKYLVDKHQERLIRKEDEDALLSICDTVEKAKSSDYNNNDSSFALARLNGERPWVKSHFKGRSERLKEEKKRQEMIDKDRGEERKKGILVGVPSYLTGRHR